MLLALQLRIKTMYSKWKKEKERVQLERKAYASSAISYSQRVRNLIEDMKATAGKGEYVLEKQFSADDWDLRGFTGYQLMQTMAGYRIKCIVEPYGNTSVVTLSWKR